jgi:hypothetical protein
MSNDWLPLHLPSCSKCQKTWIKVNHKNCYLKGEILVEPHQQIVKCTKCISSWELMQTKFYCPCGNEFCSSDIKQALSTVALLRQRLIQKLSEMDEYENRIIQNSKSSFQQWANNVSYEIGKLLGISTSVMGKVIESLFDFLK